MPSYNCCRCGFKTKQKQDFRRHLLRKNICKPILKDINEKIFYEFYKENFPEVVSKLNNTAQITHKPAENTQNNAQSIHCDYCNKKFTRKDTLTRHEKNYCKIKKELNKDLQIIELRNELRKEKSTNINNGTINNSHNTNNTNNTNNIVIQIGKENSDELLTDFEKKIIFSGGLYSMIPKLVEKVNCNDRLPQFQNLKITNLQSKYCNEYDEKTKKFIKVLRKELMNRFIEYKRYELEELCNNPDNKISDRSKQYVDKICNKIDNKEKYKEYFDELVNDVILLIYNFYN